MGGGKYLKPGILYFNEENDINCFINKDGKLMNLNELNQLLEQYNDSENIIIPELKREGNK